MRHLRTILCTVLLAGLLGLLSMPARATDLYVVVNTSNATRSLTQSDVVALFTGRTRAFPDGAQAEPYDYERNSPLRETFYMALTGLDLARINSYWARLFFSGQVQPPRALASASEVSAAIRRNPNGIGYLSTPPSDPGLRAVFVLKNAP